MLIESDLAKIFWAEVVNTACYVTNKCLIKSPKNKTPYGLFLEGNLVSVICELLNVYSLCS